MSDKNQKTYWWQKPPDRDGRRSSIRANIGFVILVAVAVALILYFLTLGRIILQLARATLRYVNKLIEAIDDDTQSALRLLADLPALGEMRAT